MKIEDIQSFTKEQLVNEDLVLEAFNTESEVEKTKLLNAFADRAKELKCSKQVNALISATKKDIANKIKEQKKAANNTTKFKHPSQQEYVCGSWIADESGVSILTDNGENIVCYHPILPVKRLFNIETKTEKVTLAYKRDNAWKEITVDKDIIASSNKIVKLASYGISVTSENAKGLVKFLSDVENLNEGNIPLQNSTSKFGWHGDLFIPYDKAVIFDDESKFKDLTYALKKCGSPDIWLDLARKIRSNKDHNEPQIYLAASFASVLVSRLDMLPFIVNLWGSTGKGKTVALMLAASIWADPGEGKFITDSYATQNAFEIRLDILNHLPLMLDDLSKVKDKCDDNFTDLVYLLCSGRGKDRSNVDLGLNKVKTWQNTILSNMERPLATETMRGGAINRILDFEMQEGYIFENGNHVVSILKDNYGFAGPTFLEFVKEIGDEAISNLRKEFEQKIKDEAKRQGSEKEEKQILPLSILLAADKLATDCIFEDGIYLDLEWMVSQLKDVDEVSEGQRAYDAIMDTLNRHHWKFDKESTGEYWGFVEDGYLNILPVVLRNEIALKENFSVKAFCSWAKKKNLLKTNNEKLQNVIKLNGKTNRYYTIKLPIDETSTDFDTVSEEEIKELPFD
jgi:hypothetical protein